MENSSFQSRKSDSKLSKKQIFGKFYQVNSSAKKQENQILDPDPDNEIPDKKLICKYIYSYINFLSGIPDSKLSKKRIFGKFSQVNSSSKKPENQILDSRS